MSRFSFFVGQHCVTLLCCHAGTLLPQLFASVLHAYQQGKALPIQPVPNCTDPYRSAWWRQGFTEPGLWTKTNFIIWFEKSHNHIKVGHSVALKGENAFEAKYFTSIYLLHPPCAESRLNWLNNTKQTRHQERLTNRSATLRKNRYFDRSVVLTFKIMVWHN